MIGPLSSQLNAIKWGEFKLGDLFEVLSSKKIYHANTIKIHDTQIENSYPYVVRAATNNGIKGFIIDDPTFTNEKNTLSFAQDTFTVFYQKQPYFTGNKVKILKPKFAFKSPKILHFISAILQFILKPLTWGLGSTTESIAEFKFYLPLKPTAKNQTLEDIDFDFMETFIAELEQCRLAELEAYLKAAGLENTALSKDEENALNVFNNSGGGNTGLRWQSFKIVDIFEVKNTRNILARDVVKDSGTTPYLCASKENNAVNSYINYNADFLDKGNCIFIGGKTFVVTYQQKDFYSNDSHNLALYLKDTHSKTKLNQLFIITCIYKALNNKYSWGDSISNTKIQNDSILLPTNPHGKIDFDFMHTLINALMKQTIQGVVQYSSAKIQAAKEIISQETPTPKDSLF
ncbi:restriction endonuclease subunit S [Helicobacter pylori]|uniref:Type II restriction endonuclease n=1 Tax=Helicobacter pylori UM037 TaxID=1321939 RepID=A0AB33Z9L0_HELPX|nr:restriction endonuclease subunit S [Helicobacter pylori]AGL69125.1 restriction endonuclease [Helicobacter pylori UM037]EQK95372.1 type II restriction endonuclease [Helicobacter pylori UM037]